MRRNRTDAVHHSPPQSITIEQPAPSLFALAIGIDEYLSNGTPRVPKGQIKNLRNEEATKVTISMEINSLGNNTAIKKGDPILIFAEHGAETNAPAPTGRYKCWFHMTLSPADLTAKKSDNITVILGCCHSGSCMRTDDDGPTFAVRAIDLPEAYTVAQDLLHDIEPDARASVVAKGFEKTGLLSHVLLSACQAEQTAMEKHGRGDVIINLPDLQDPQCEGVHQSRNIFNSKVASPQRELYHIRASSDTLGQYILEGCEAHGITGKAQFVVFAARRMTSALGTVVAINTTVSATTCKLSSRGNRTLFPLTAPGYALQTRVGEDQDVRLFVEPDKWLSGVFKQTANKTQAGERGFRLVESRDDELDLVVAADVKTDDEDAIHRILSSSSDFYWHLHRSNKRNPLTGKVTLECMKPKETGEYTNDLREVLNPDSNDENLNVGGVIMVDVDKATIYGFEITNTTSVPLYVSMFCFDVSDFSISSYYQPGRAKKDIDVSLPPGDSLTIGYGFLKRFFSTEYMDLSGVVQNSLFMTPVRAGNLR
ncbi:hypothetical protein EDD85DRAFT_969153 [Armillaria nabsnona]|nr:hypothetical protein EDD85DRAFT_969153 [Armillaria nabsnona]